MRQLLLVLSVLFLSTACSNFHMEKRRYNKGFHISFNKNRLKKNTDSNEKETLAEDKTSNKSSEFIVKNSSELALTKTDAIEAPLDAANESNTIQASHSKSKPTHSVDEVEDAIKDVSETTAAIITSRGAASKSTEKSGVNALWYFAIIGVLPVLFDTKQQSINISLWASTNVSKAKVAMGGLYALGAVSSFLLGDIWQPVLEDWMLIVPLTLAGSILVADAVKKEKKSGFLTRKLSYAAVNTSSFFGTLAMGAQSKLNVLQLMDPETQAGLGQGAAAFISVLLVLAMVAAILGVAMIACNLSCSGYGILALIVMAGGAFLVLFLGTWGILGAVRGRERNSDNLKAALITGMVAALLILVPVGIAFIAGF